MLNAVRVNFGNTPLTINKLKKILIKPEKYYFDEAIGSLLNERLFTFMFRGNEYVQLLPKTPSAYLTAHHLNPLKQTLKRINEFRDKPLSTTELYSFLDSVMESEAFPETRDNKAFIGVEAGFKKETPKGPNVPANPDELMREWYMADKPAPRQPSTIPLPKTWKRYSEWSSSQDRKPDPMEFVKWLRDLYIRGKAELNHHETPRDIPEEERPYLFDLRPGFTIYWWKYTGE